VKWNFWHPFISFVDLFVFAARPVRLSKVQYDHDSPGLELREPISYW
jgi:hypothetical protein